MDGEVLKDDFAAGSIASLTSAIEDLGAGQMPMSDGLRSSWPGIGREWVLPWVEELGRDLHLTAKALGSAARAGEGPEGVEHVETALWRLAAGREKLHAVIALIFGVDALRISRNGKVIRRFEPDIGANRKRLREVAGEHPASEELLGVDAALGGHRFLKLRHQMTHSLAPILKWRSLMWFEVAVVKRGGTVGWQGKHLEPSRQLQGSVPREKLFTRTLADGEAATQLLADATEKLAKLAWAVGVIAPPPILWHVLETDQLFEDRQSASETSRLAAELPPPLGSDVTDE